LCLNSESIKFLNKIIKKTFCVGERKFQKIGQEITSVYFLTVVLHEIYLEKIGCDEQLFLVCPYRVSVSPMNISWSRRKTHIPYYHAAFFILAI